MADENTDLNVPAPGATPPEGTPPDANLDVGKPTVPPVVEPKVDPVVAFAPTGDAAMDVALDFFGKAGLKPDSAAMLLASKGDFSVLKAELAAKGKQGWEQFVNIAEQSFGRAKSAAESKATATKAAVLAVAGGEKEWEAIRTYIGEKADPAELAEINTALKAGGFLAKATAKYMRDVYEAGTGTVKTEEVGDLAPANRARQPSGNAPMTAAEYSAAVQALSAKVGAHRVDASPEYAALKARRQAALR